MRYQDIYILINLYNTRHRSSKTKSLPAMFLDLFLLFLKSEELLYETINLLSTCNSGCFQSKSQLSYVFI